MARCNSNNKKNIKFSLTPPVEHDGVIALNNTQEKAATDNNGSYDQENPDIRYSLSDYSEADRFDLIKVQFRLNRDQLFHLIAPSTQPIKEKETLLDTLIASRHNLNNKLLDAINEKIELIEKELVRLSIQRDIFNKDFPPEGDFYNAAIEILKKLRHVSSNLLSANDPVALRQVLLAGIERIELTSEGDFQIYGSSPNYKGWYPGRDSNPLPPDQKSGALSR